MSPEKQMKAGNQKQKIMLVATVLIIIFVAWQAFKLMGGGGSDAAPATPAPTTANKAAVRPGGNGGGAANQAAAVVSAPEAVQAPKQVPVPSNPEILKIQQDTQAKYISAINELQMLKLQKDIAETKQAITSSILANATAEKSITDLLTVQQMPTSSYAGPALSPSNASSAGIEALPKPVVAVANLQETPYVVTSVAFRNDRWAAVVSYQDKYYNVNVGDILTPDGSMVLAIDRNGVTLEGKDKIKRKVLINSGLQ